MVQQRQISFTKDELKALSKIIFDAGIAYSLPKELVLCLRKVDNCLDELNTVEETEQRQWRLPF